ncbi:MAG: FmdE family protein [Desulfobacca sp.]|nr:FmdE family protein [Desulfobacca sp.]
MHIGPYSFAEFVELAKSFHGFPAPGVLIGGFMVALAQRQVPTGVLYDAISETQKCLPDAVQLLTPCTMGNGWLRVLPLGRYAVTLYDKFQGQGWRVFVDPDKLGAWPAIKEWFLKQKPKKQQDTPALMDQIRQAGSQICSLASVQVRPEWLAVLPERKFSICPRCGEAFPAADGLICLGCQGQAPYVLIEKSIGPVEKPNLRSVPVEDAVGHKLLHDLTLIVPGVSKGPAFRRGEVITAGDLCRLHQMGRQHVYLMPRNPPEDDWIHEDQIAALFGQAMAGAGVEVQGPPQEGKVNLVAAHSGLLIVDQDRLQRFNLVPEVMCASRKGYRVVEKGQVVAGTRAIPLFLAKRYLEPALELLSAGPLFAVKPLRPAQVGILVTGTEVFRGLVEDRFAPLIAAKVQKYHCPVIDSLIVPDDREEICQAVQRLLAAGCDLLVTTAGLSVDPDDLTRQGLIDAGVTDLLYGAPILPGAMTLLARLGSVPVIGVPACALYFRHTSFDVLLPRLLAGVAINRQDLAALGHGALCQECSTCTFPHCQFGA